ncbi:MAG TPA: GNAT family N-acetyltransferase [Thermoplasmata archaeon]|nr:GNAT family N-acetyltransferase [Thermoplasmata archaeon]
MELRGVLWGDFESLFAFRRSRYDAIERDPTYGMVSQPAPPTLPEFASWFGQLHREILERRTVCSLAVEDGKVVGMCSVRGEGTHRETRHVGALGLEVLEGYRRRGIGEELLRHALECCRGVFEDVTLAVIPSNTGARRLYERLGFVAYGVAPRAFQRAGTYHDFVLMHRRLA